MECTDHRIERELVSRRLVSALREGIETARVHPPRAMRLAGRLLVFLLVVSACSQQSDETVGDSSSPNGPPVGEKLREASPQDWAVASKLAEFVSETFGRESGPSGEDERIWNSDSSYEGGWSHGLKHGMGVETTADGSRFEGEFRNGAQVGPGGTPD
ncbi:MAG: hypothetical protein J4G09_02180 [Proteobacteria bacterium]|nr:hypothetical protein [Pseudomonadota bacterium]